MGIRQEVTFKQNSEVFRRLEEVANVATLTPEQRYHYEADVKIVRDTINQIRGAYQDGEETGIVIGRAEGIEIGEINERKKSISLMLSFGIPPHKIAEKYGLTTDEILQIAKTK